MAAVKASQHTEHRRVVVGRRLCLLIVVPLVHEIVMGVGAAHNGADQYVGIAQLPGEPRVVAFPAAHGCRIHLDGHDR